MLSAMRLTLDSFKNHAWPLTLTIFASGLLTLCLTKVVGGITEDCGVIPPWLQVTSLVPSANAFKFKDCGSYAAPIKALKILILLKFDSSKGLFDLKETPYIFEYFRILYLNLFEIQFWIWNLCSRFQRFGISYAVLFCDGPLTTVIYGMRDCRS